MTNFSKLCAITVLYNPGESFHKNILSYLTQVDHLFIIDNSDKSHQAILENELKPYLDKITYLCNHHNLGIAKALNQGAEKALEAGFDYALTMDQDSEFAKGGIDLIKTLISKLHSAQETPGMIAANAYWKSDITELPPPPKSLEEAAISHPVLIITSGSVINLKAWQAVNGFDDSLFIDEVDHDYCLNLLVNGFKLYKIENLSFKHQLGEFSWHKLLGFHAKVSHHNATRRYYITRNRLYLIKKYKKAFPDLMRLYRKEMVKDFLKLCLFEEKRIKKISNTILGILHYLLGKKGELT